MDFFGWKLLGCRCFDVWVVFGWFLLDFETPPPAFPASSMLFTAILINFGARGGVRGPWEGPCQHLLIGKFFDMLLFDVWKGSELAFDHLRQLFFGKVLFSVCMYGDIEIWLREHLEGTHLGAELDLELRKSLRLALFCLNALI